MGGGGGGEGGGQSFTTVAQKYKLLSLNRNMLSLINPNIFSEIHKVSVIQSNDKLDIKCLRYT